MDFELDMWSSDLSVASTSADALWDLERFLNAQEPAPTDVRTDGSTTTVIGAKRLKSCAPCRIRRVKYVPRSWSDAASVTLTRSCTDRCDRTGDGKGDCGFDFENSGVHRADA